MSRNASGKNFELRTELARLLSNVCIEWDADDDDDDKDKGASGSGDGTDDEGGEGESGASGSDSGGDATVKDPDKKRLSDEAAKHRQTAKEAKAELASTQKKLREIEDKDKSELEKAQRDNVEKDRLIAEKDAIISKQAVQVAFVMSGAAALFRDSEDALRLLDLSDLKPNEDGEIDRKEVKSRAEALLKAKGYLAPDGSNDGGDGTPGGSPNNGRRGKKADEAATRQKLAAKFPALASRS